MKKSLLPLALCLAVFRKALPEPRGEFLINAVKAAIGKNRHHVAGMEPGHDAVYDRLHIGEELGFGSGLMQRAHHLFRVEPLGLRNALLLVDAGQHNAVGQAQALDQIAFEHLAPERIRTRL
jgi:hypothetical protein